MKKLATVFLLVIMGLGATLRTYKLHEPLGDWHSWRQADTASVAREYVKAGKIDLLHPQYHDLSSIPSGLDNLAGWRFVEFPLRDALHAQLVMWFPSVGLVEWGRIISIVASTLTIGLIYLVVTYLSGSRAGLFSALIFAILPYNIYYGRVILPEPMLVLFMLLSLYAFFRAWDSGKPKWWLATLVALATTLLFKPTGAVILLPMFGYGLGSLGKISIRNTIFALLLPLLAFVPYLLWRRYLAAFPEGIPASSWLFNGNGIRLKGAWFRWLFGERLGKMILGYWGLLPLGFGLHRLGGKLKETLVYGGLLLGSLTYMAVIATGNVQHDYYQIQIMPTVAILVGLGIDYMLTLSKGFKLVTTTILIVTSLSLMLALSWYELQGFFWVNNRAMVQAGIELDAISPKDALVIAPYMGDTAFLFQTNRRGWPIGGAIEFKINSGASYYVTTTKDAEYQDLVSKYTLVKDTDQFSIIKLSK
ncbi:MAG: glycosyltransferase family 39 protein [bacterium]